MLCGLVVDVLDLVVGELVRVVCERGAAVDDLVGSARSGPTRSGLAPQCPLTFLVRLNKCAQLVVEVAVRAML